MKEWTFGPLFLIFSKKQKTRRSALLFLNEGVDDGGSALHSLNDEVDDGMGTPPFTFSIKEKARGSDLNFLNEEVEDAGPALHFFQKWRRREVPLFAFSVME